jgi:hypothetical protein
MGSYLLWEKHPIVLVCACFDFLGCGKRGGDLIFIFCFIVVMVVPVIHHLARLPGGQVRPVLLLDFPLRHGKSGGRSQEPLSISHPTTPTRISSG